jgi:hypothetical protein
LPSTIRSTPASSVAMAREICRRAACVSFMVREP